MGRTREKRKNSRARLIREFVFIQDGGAPRQTRTAVSGSGGQRSIHCLRGRVTYAVEKVIVSELSLFHRIGYVTQLTNPPGRRKSTIMATTRRVPGGFGRKCYEHYRHFY